MMIEEMKQGYFLKLNWHRSEPIWNEIYDWLHETYGSESRRYQFYDNHRLLLFRDEEDTIAFKLRWL